VINEICPFLLLADVRIWPQASPPGLNSSVVRQSGVHQPQAWLAIRICLGLDEKMLPWVAQNRPEAVAKVLFATRKVEANSKDSYG
jgi:hypothetical protein